MGQEDGAAQVTSAAGPYAPLHRSRLFITSLAYWRWVGETLNSISRSTRKRHRSFFFGGGCLFWLVLIWVVMLYYLLVISLVATALFGVVAVDAVLSTFGWIDEKRLQLVDRTLSTHFRCGPSSCRGSRHHRYGRHHRPSCDHLRPRRPRASQRSSRSWQICTSRGC